MAILFDWYEDPKPSDKQQGENKKTLHPRIKYNVPQGPTYCGGVFRNVAH